MSLLNNMIPNSLNKIPLLSNALFTKLFKIFFWETLMLFIHVKIPYFDKKDYLQNCFLCYSLNFDPLPLPQFQLHCQVIDAGKTRLYSTCCQCSSGETFPSKYPVSWTTWSSWKMFPLGRTSIVVTLMRASQIGEFLLSFRRKISRQKKQRICCVMA